MQENNLPNNESNDRMNLDFVLKEAGDAPDFIVDLLETFQISVNDQILSLEAIIQSGDITHLYATVHKLKPSLKMFALDASLDCVRVIEYGIQDKLPIRTLLSQARELKHKLGLIGAQTTKLINTYQNSL